jgi:two-component system nitrogen regulation sensor histidine kinase NtrY
LKPTGTRFSSATDPRNPEEAVIERDRRRRKKRIRIIILVSLVLFALFTYLETRVFELGTVPLPVSGNVLIFVLINLNMLLLLLVIFLVLRELTQLVFERKRRILGTRLRTKLVISFISLSLIPTGLLFFVALQFVSTSMDYWFNSNVEQSLLESLNIAKEVYQGTKDEVVRQGRNIAGQLEARPVGHPLTPTLKEALTGHGLASVEVLSDERVVVAAEVTRSLAGQALPEIPMEYLRRTLEGERELVAAQPFPGGGELIRGFTLVRFGDDRPGVLVIARLIPPERLARMETISTGLEGYRQLMMLKAPLKTSLIVILLIVTLLIVFCAVWFGFYVANGLTGPIKRLADATHRIAEGDLDFVLEKTSGDEMGTLVDSFNQMTHDLRVSRGQIVATSQELDNRRRYTEIILQNVAAGVISLDDSGKIITINRFAEELLKIRKEDLLGRHYRAILRQEHLHVLETFLAELARSGRPSIQRPLRLTVGEETFSLRVNFTRLEDEEHRPLGVVLVFDNLTELEKAQRMAAWREVARRIAHEVKNPLTPIQLSAQRLRKKYLDRFASEGEVFDLCTKTIINQVDELQRLVSEFSSFARMPAIQKSRNNLAEMAKEVLALYQEAHRDIAFSLAVDEGMPEFLFDLKQLKRVFINLLDNAVAAMAERGAIDVVIGCDREQKLVILEVRDNGPGVRDEDKSRLFEPYFSTKKSGTGLGLAIAGTAVADHGGVIRVRDNEPAGAVFVVELPLLLE